MFFTLRADSWETTRLIAKYLTRWAFRGQGNALWSLEASLHRSARLFGSRDDLLMGNEFGSLPNREIVMLKEFQRRAHHYIADLPSANQSLEWLALIQHHGGPTRLLDFTHSFYVAAFFALESANEDVAVWAVNLEYLENAVRKKLNMGKRSGDDTTSTTNTKLVGIAESYIGAKAAERLVIHVEPERMNQRISIQQGLFLLPCDVTSSFIDNLTATFDMPTDVMTGQPDIVITQEDLQSTMLSMKAGVLKIIIPSRSIYVALSDLNSMNVNSATLFPGLDGFAHSLNRYLRLPTFSLKDDEFYDRFK